MLTSYYYITLAENNKLPTVTLTPYPETDSHWLEAEGLKEVWFWDHPYPLWLGEVIKTRLVSALPNSTPVHRRLLKKIIRREAKGWGWSVSGTWVKIQEAQAVSDFTDFTLEIAAGTDLEKILPGRALTLLEIKRLLAREGIALSPPALHFVLQVQVLAGSLRLQAGVGPDRFGRFTCRRCGETQRIEEGYAHGHPEQFWSCGACRRMGVVTSSTPLYQWVGQRRSLAPMAGLDLVLPELTGWQQAAALAAVEWGESQAQNRLLIWAVCGAGKTEIIFPVIHRAMVRGERVLLTVPRREVASELGKRVERSFPGLEFTLLYGGKKREFTTSPLTVCTTHQLLRFYHQFDLAILDEADAYPFNYEPMLAKALHRSLRPTGRLIYMTATPDAAWRRAAQRGKVDLIKIPLRYHGYPLPVPVLKKLRLPPPQLHTYRDYTLPLEIIEFLQEVLAQGRKALVFVPTVNLTEVVGSYLKRQAVFTSGSCVDFLHANDPLREAKLAEFAAGKLKILVTTTLLERGLTFRDLDVMILYADAKRIFSTETLVQIAGRVGRSADSPCGKTLMVGRMITREMHGAKLWMEEMNEEARRLGFLKKV